METPCVRVSTWRPPSARRVTVHNDASSAQTPLERRERRTFHTRHRVTPAMLYVVTARERTDAEHRTFRRKGT